MIRPINAAHAQKSLRMCRINFYKRTLSLMRTRLYAQESESGKEGYRFEIALQ